MKIELESSIFKTEIYLLKSTIINMTKLLKSEKAILTAFNNTMYYS